MALKMALVAIRLLSEMVILIRQFRLAVLFSLLLFWATSTRTQAQQPFVHSNDVLFTVRTDHKEYNIGDQIVIHYTIKNIGNGAYYVPRSQWETKCGNPPHLWSRLEDSSGKHYEPGYMGSCVGPSRMSISERMRKDALVLKPGQKVSGSYSFDSKIFADRLKPGAYRLEAVLHGWNQSFDKSELSELAGLGAPFLLGESVASSEVEFGRGGK
jgi:hypothetical protein